uniref:Uncharacterized protein n=1 Tax=Romanomermis culicivorax TaxID=13658 RepID=A0A915L8C0_ROMCU
MPPGQEWQFLVPFSENEGQGHLWNGLIPNLNQDNNTSLETQKAKLQPNSPQTGRASFNYLLAQNESIFPNEIKDVPFCLG